MKVEPSRVRKADIVRYLRGRNAKTIKEVARAMKVSYRTASKYLAQLRADGKVKLDSFSKPYKYYVSIRNEI